MYVPRIAFLDLTSSYLCSVVNYQTYKLAIRFQRYNKMLVARTCKYVKRKKSMMKSYMIDANNPFNIFCFLVCVKESCNSIEVSEKIALWILPNFMKGGPRASSNSLLVPIGFRKNTYAQT